MTKRWQYKRALALPLAIGLLSYGGVRLAIAPIGDAIAAKIARAVPPAPSGAPVPASESADPLPVAPIPDPTDEQLEAVGVRVPPPPKGATRATPLATEARRADDDAGSGASANDTTADASPGALPTSDPPKATIFVPAAAVSRALERRDVGATNALSPDGSALGARLVGVSKYRTGLRDGDVVVSVAGTRTPNVNAMTSAAVGAASTGVPRISGRVLRGDTLIAVVLELPR